MSRDRIDPSKLGYRPCVGIMVLNRAGPRLGRPPCGCSRRAGGAAAPGGRCRRGHRQGRGPAQGGPARARTRRPASAASPSSPRRLAGCATSCRPTSSARPGAASTGARSRSGSPRASSAPTARSRSPRPTGHKVEFDAWRWVALGELSELIVPFKRDVYRQVVEAFAAYAVPSASDSFSDSASNFTNQRHRMVEFFGYSVFDSSVDNL